MRLRGRVAPAPMDTIHVIIINNLNKRAGVRSCSLMNKNKEEKKKAWLRVLELHISREAICECDDCSRCVSACAHVKRTISPYRYSHIRICYAIVT